MKRPVYELHSVDECPKDCYDHFAMRYNNGKWYQRLWSNLVGSLQWLVPGIGVKRWILLILAGTTLIGVGLGILILDVYRNTPDTWWLPIISTASLRFIYRPLRAIIFGSMGLGFILVGIYGLNRTLMKPYLRPGSRVVDALSRHRRRERGPRIAVIGGGTGLSTLLRGLKEYTHNITAIVTVADDGGSSGRLRRDIGILPPGDIRNCLASLSNDEALLSQLFQYRFPAGYAGLEGHSFGNLFISALAEITGSFEVAVAESGRVLSVHGRVLPSTLHDVRLLADIALPNLTAEIRIEGESHIPEVSGKVRRVWLEPNNPPAFPQAIRDILSADMIIVGPGSLYTSLLPVLLVPDIAQAVKASKALKIYVSNVATQPGETDHYSCRDHLHAIQAHTGLDLFDIVVANKRYQGRLSENSDWVKVDPELSQEQALYLADLADQERPWRHNSEKLSRVLMDLFEERTGPLVE